MNIFIEGIGGTFAVGPDDADMLLRMVEEAHRPFVTRPYPGDIATEWRRRWQRSQHKGSAERTVPLRYSPNAGEATAALREAYSGTGKRISVEPAKEFPMEDAVAAIVKRWPGIELDQPERAWNSRKEIAELQRMRMVVQQQREMPASQSQHSGGLITQAWR